MTEIKSLEIPDEIEQYLLFKELNEHPSDKSIFSEVFEKCNRQCDIIQTGGGRPNVKEINLACNFNMEKMFESLNQDLSQLCSKNATNTTKSDTTAHLKEYFDSIQQLTDDAFSYINYKDLELQQKFSKIMIEMSSDLIISDDTISHIDYLPKIVREINNLKEYIERVSSKMDHERRLALYFQQLEIIDKSLLKLMTETIMKNDLFIHNFIKFNWIDMLQKCTTFSDAFGEFNRKLALRINPNYLLSIGSINNRIASQFFYKENSNNFFDNRLLFAKITNEYYNGLTSGLGGIIAQIITEMLASSRGFDKTKKHVSIDLANNKLSIGKQQMTPNHVACFCTINYQNSPLVLMNYTIDYLISNICINYFLNVNDQTASTLFGILVDLLNNEPFSELTNLVYARWVSWICVWSGIIESTAWESNLVIKVQDPKIKDIAFKHMNNYIKTPTEINVKLISNSTAYHSTIDQSKVNEYLNNPKSFPDKNEFTISSAISSQMFSPVFLNSSIENELELKLIILNKLGKLSCISLHNYAKFIFSPIQIKSNELTIKF